MFTERIGAVELISRPEGRVALAGTLLAFLQVGWSLDTSTNLNTNTNTNLYKCKFKYKICTCWY